MEWVRSEQGRKSHDKTKQQAHREQKTAVRDNDRGYWIKQAQAAFNAYIRARDDALPCVSCGRHHSGQYHAGHYRTVGANPELRFEPDNCHKQCAPCNNHLSGNLVNYRMQLIERIGIERVEWLEGPHDAKKYSIDDLKGIVKEYKDKLKQLGA